MRLVLSSFFLCLFFICAPVFGENFYKEYTVNVSGIKIGELGWEININKKKYSNKISLKSKGLLSGIYRFKGEYFSEGYVINNNLKPIKYNHFWKTKKTTKKMDLVFKDGKLKSLIQTPVEKEHLRINVFDIKYNKDPLTAFLQIMLGDKSTLVLDGRRSYKMNAVLNNNTNETAIEVSNYFNLWADHKRSKFEKITFEKKDGGLFPLKINIHFDGRVFRLEQI